MKKIFWFLFIIFIGCNGSTKKTNTIENNKTEIDDIQEEQDINLEKIYYVNSFNGLNLRISPDTNNEIIMLLPNNAEIIILDESDKYETIGDLISKWYKIKYFDNTGWVFGGYLSNISASERIIGNWRANKKWTEKVSMNYNDYENYEEYMMTMVGSIGRGFSNDGKCDLGFFESEGFWGEWEINGDKLYIETEWWNNEPPTFSKEIFYYEFIDNTTMKLGLIKNENDVNWVVYYKL